MTIKRQVKAPVFFSAVITWDLKAGSNPVCTIISDDVKHLILG